MAKKPETINYHKENWARGPWDKEPDRVEFQSSGFDCLMVRNGMGAWCGYVAVPRGHRFYKKHYNDVDVSVHGGLTYADKCHGPVCHIPKPGRPDDVWWLGFDCAHSHDDVPSMMPGARFSLDYMAKYPEGFKTYKDVEWVKREVRHLARQLKRA